MPRRPQSQSALRAPLNKMLGTEANVRLLRELTRAGIPLAAGELAQRAQIGRTGVYPVLSALEHSGIVEFVGAGATRQVRLRKAHPLAAPLANLFRSETDRIESLVAALRKLLERFEKTITSAWLTDGTPGGELADPDTMTCYIVAEPRALPSVVDRIEDNLVEIERSFQVHLEVVPLSRSEVVSRVPIQSLDDAILLAGIPPMALVEHAGTARAVRNLSVHGYHDTGSRLLALAVAAKLRHDPSITRRIRANILSRMERASDQERRELREWLRIVSTMSPAKLQRFLVDESERAVRLRQSLPALGVLTSRERDKILAAQSEKEVIALVAPRR